MSQQDDQYQDENENDDQADEADQPREGRNIAQMRKKADRTDQAEADALAAKRELAFTKAGVDTDRPLAQTLMAAYTGELTKEAVRQFLEAQGALVVLGVEDKTVETQGAQAVTTTPLEPGEADLSRERQEIASTATPAGPLPTDDPGQVGLDNFVAGMARGDSRETASGAYFSDLFDAAARGDKRVLVEKTADRT